MQCILCNNHAFNSQLGILEVIGDRYSSSNTNHKMMTVAGSFSDASDSLFNGDYYFEVVHSQNVGTLVFSGYGHSGSTLVYIITQNSNWSKVESSDKYLSDFQNPKPGYNYYYFGVVEQDDKIYLVGGFTGSYQNTVQVVNFRDVDDLLTAQTRQWILMENLKNAVYTPAVVHRENELQERSIDKKTSLRILRITFRVFLAIFCQKIVRSSHKVKKTNKNQ